MRGLDFEHAAQAQRPDPNRVDIACFVGFVARREGALPASVRAELARARWTDGPAAQKTVAITLMDEARNPVRTWLLRGCIPMKYTGPTLAGKGGGDVAMEEIVLSAEGFEIQA